MFFGKFGNSSTLFSLKEPSRRKRDEENNAGNSLIVDYQALYKVRLDETAFEQMKRAENATENAELISKISEISETKFNEVTQNTAIFIEPPTFGVEMITKVVIEIPEDLFVANSTSTEEAKEQIIAINGTEMTVEKVEETVIENLAKSSTTLSDLFKKLGIPVTPTTPTTTGLS